ncbi:MAG: aminoacyl-tRNA hydrolase [Bdellovibrionales bacterium]|nr:aminoacyl-tRNA hydrolase [Bdellovibrionales bacterium]
MAEGPSYPFLVVGLGNPGSEYRHTPHNIGFEVVEALAKHWNAHEFQKKFKGLLAEVHRPAGKVLLLKPQTYMNLSGESVAEVVNFFKLDPASQMVVVVDDLDLPPGQLRLRKSGGTGGHNGLRSIQECLGMADYPRLRVGIGKSATRDGASHVLSKIPKSQQVLYAEAVENCVASVEHCVQDGVTLAMNWVNSLGNKNEP